MRKLCDRCLAPLPYGYRLLFCERSRKETIEGFLEQQIARQSCNLQHLTHKASLIETAYKYPDMSAYEMR